MRNLFLLSLLLFTSCVPFWVEESEVTAPVEEAHDIGDSVKNNAEKVPFVSMPKGFQIEYFADVAGARSMTLGEKYLYMGTRAEGKVYRLDLETKEVEIIASGLNVPNGVAYHNGSLFVGEINRILRYDNVEMEQISEPKAIFTDLPSDRHHGWKYIAIGPDEKLYIPIGAPCNVCDNKQQPYSTINRINLDGTGFETVAYGVRNTVGFDWDDRSGRLWFTDNGRDMMGDNLPADELNVISENGEDFGFPYCHQGDTLDPQFGTGRNCDDYTAPVQQLGPHVAALGMKFYRGDMFPEEYHGRIFIAEHGSWNRTEKIGYRISFIRLSWELSEGYEIFAQGWLDEETGEVNGRPVDIVELNDGSLLVSDDHAGKIYRIYYEESKD